jgi:RNA polymerase-interacting CarD/CdnL/TRCF family regulator
MLMGFASMAQKAEVLYFKADLACCQAKACNALEGEVKAIVEKNFNGETVVFKEVKLTDEGNKDLVAKHNAKSQTVVIVSNRKKKETVVDVSDIIRAYSRNQNKEELEKQLLAKINETMK